MNAQRRPGGKLLAPMVLETDRGVGDAMVEIGPEHPDFAMWDEWLKLIGVPDAPQRETFTVGEERFNPYHDSAGKFASKQAAVAGAGLGMSAQQVAQGIAARSAKNEPAITADMEAVAGARGAKLVGLEYKLKSEKSLTRKIRKDARNKHTTNASAGAAISDASRYTMTLPPGKYAQGAVDALGDLQGRGHTVLRVKSSWKDGAEYKGVNVKMRAPNGQAYELQFHTPQSFSVKEFINHPMYEKERASKNAFIKRNAKRVQIRNSAMIERPPGVEKIAMAYTR